MGLTYHGLRHTVGKLIVDGGGDTRDVQSILGHASEVSSAHYSREADQRKRASATIRRLERNERRKLDKKAN
jgi:integrase